MFNMIFTVVLLIESIFFTAMLMLLLLSWLSGENTNIADGLWKAIVLIRNVCRVLLKDECTTSKNEDPNVEESESADSSDNQACDQTSSSLTADFILPSFPVYVSTTQSSDNVIQSIDLDVEEPESADSSGNQPCDQISSSLTAELISPPFPLYVWASQSGDNAAQNIDESCMKSIIRVVNLTIRRVQSVEETLKYFHFVLFDLNMGEQMYRRIYCHLHDQLDWWHYRIADSELEIVGKLYGGFIVEGIKLNIPNEWKPSARMVLNHLENYDTQYLNFARFAFEQLNQDLPQEYSHLIKNMIDKPQITIRKKQPTDSIIPPYASNYTYL